jgi:hypothetical protein
MSLYHHHRKHESRATHICIPLEQAVMRLETALSRHDEHR